MIRKKPFARVIPTRSVLYRTGYPERHFPAGQRPQPDNKLTTNYAK